MNPISDFRAVAALIAIVSAVFGIGGVFVSYKLFLNRLDERIRDIEELLGLEGDKAGAFKSRLEDIEAKVNSATEDAIMPGDSVALELTDGRGRMGLDVPLPGSGLRLSENKGPYVCARVGGGGSWKISKIGSN
ncbi:MAG: hypothetical protein AAFU80_04415 [Pseudomonadota bacterium]